MSTDDDDLRTSTSATAYDGDDCGDFYDRVRLDSADEKRDNFVKSIHLCK